MILNGVMDIYCMSYDYVVHFWAQHVGGSELSREQPLPGYTLVYISA